MKVFTLSALALTLVGLSSSASAQIKVLYLANDDLYYAQPAFNRIIGGDARFDFANSAVKEAYYISSLAEMQAYDVVWFGANYPIYSSEFLADYIEGGGRVVASSFVGARYYEAAQDFLARLPVTNPTTYGAQTLDVANSNMSHPIMQGVNAFGVSEWAGDFLSVRPGAVAVATYESGLPMVTLNAAGNVGYVSAFGQTTEWEGTVTGDFDRVFQNTLAYVGSSQPVPEPASMAVLGLGLAALRRRRAKK